MKRGFHTIMAAQFFSSLADNALFVAAVELLRSQENNVHLLLFRLKEGRKRQIRYMCSAAHLVVLSLKRVAIGGLRLPEDLQPGAWRDLAPEERNLLLNGW